jgi:hypothetical protein
MMNELAEWEIEHGVGTATVKVNGEDVSGQINALSLHISRGEVPILVLHRLGKAGTIKGTGIVEVGGGPVDLESLDPAELEAEALSRQQWGDDRNFTATLLDIIKEKVS